jgi:pimeloyl-ACP methyl ester carboxylesterase
VRAVDLIEEVPDWFRDALGAPVDIGSVVVEGASIHYRAWGERSQTGTVLVHGGAAHSRWWDHVAPQLSAGRRVVALDLSGHGDSDRREDYQLDLWAREVVDVATGAGISGPPTVVGHSMGGFVTLRAASIFGDQLAGAIIVDSPVRDITPEQRAALEQRAFGPIRVYPTRADVLAHFRPVPDEGRRMLPYAVAHVAESSIRETDGGFCWKFDPRIFGRPDFPAAQLSQLSRLDCRVALFRGEHGLLSEQMSEVMYDRLGRVAPIIEIPDAGHHVMLDQPLSLITGIRTLLSDWEHSTPS